MSADDLRRALPAWNSEHLAAYKARLAQAFVDGLKNAPKAATRKRGFARKRFGRKSRPA
jgi:hypothetical protein